MKNETAIRSLFGITQQEMAMLLNVSRSLLSLYELGKRDLPLPAQQLLAEMLVYVQSAEKKTKTESDKQQKQNRKYFESQLHENEYQQLKLVRDIDATEKKQEAQMRLSKLNDFLDKHHAKHKKAENALRSSIANKAKYALSNNYDRMLEQQRIKLELLQFEKSLLESKIK